MALKFVKLKSFYFCATLAQAMKEMEMRGWRKLPVMDKEAPPEAVVTYAKRGLGAFLCWESGQFLVLHYRRQHEPDHEMAT